MSKKLAVGLQYRRGMDAPKIVATGRGQRAVEMVEIARNEGIPVVRDDLLVGVLSFAAVDSFVPEEVYAVLADIFVFVYKARSPVEPETTKTKRGD